MQLIIFEVISKKYIYLERSFDFRNVIERKRERNEMEQMSQFVYRRKKDLLVKFKSEVFIVSFERISEIWRGVHSYAI